MRRKKIFSPHLSSSQIREFEVHVKHNMKRAYFTALGFVGSHDSAVELSQEAFIRAYSNYGSFDRNKKFFTWYYKILKNLCLNFIRDSKMVHADVIFESSGSSSSSDNPISKIEQKEIQAKVQEALFRLEENDREILILKEFQGISYREISELMEIPMGTVMSKLYYARKKLAEQLRRIL